MTKQMTKTQQALLILLDAGCDHKEIARLFGITDAQLQELCPNGVENEDREFTAKRDERQSKVSIVTDVNPFRPDRCVLPFKFNGSRRDKFAKGKRPCNDLSQVYEPPRQRRHVTVLFDKDAVGPKSF
ncbi:hypothetical protein [Sulfitobacter sp. 1A13679]|uniref:hypothetical protein n=1 Tax=Sulfitobacter TaxID=60136 RepID=UPI00374708B2